jgi:hypothetical protein
MSQKKNFFDRFIKRFPRKRTEYSKMERRRWIFWLTAAAAVTNVIEASNNCDGVAAAAEARGVLGLAISDFHPSPIIGECLKLSVKLFV